MERSVATGLTSFVDFYGFILPSFTNTYNMEKYTRTVSQNCASL